MRRFRESQNHRPESPQPGFARRALRARRLWPALVIGMALLVALGAAACSGATSTTTASSAATSTTAAAVALANSSDTSPAAQTLENVTTEIVSPAEIVAAKVSASVVNVRVKGVTVSPFYGQEQYEGVGSGIVYTSDGYILTNDHVVSQNGKAVDSVVVTLATGETLDATIVARDASRDLALIKVNKTGLIPVVFAPSSAVKIGQWAIAIGSPLDYRNSVTEGIVSGLKRDLPTGDPSSPQLTGLLQTDAAISPGNSGGGLFNASGELIGMPEAYIPPSSGGAENIGFAIPADTVASVASQLIGR
jgi:S1-C subfamily serine protease